MKNQILKELTSLDKTVITVYSISVIIFIASIVQLIWNVASTWPKNKRAKSL
jgi:hypothetical protein